MEICVAETRQILHSCYRGYPTTNQNLKAICETLSQVHHILKASMCHQEQRFGFEGVYSTKNGIMEIESPVGVALNIIFIRCHNFVVIFPKSPSLSLLLFSCRDSILQSRLRVSSRTLSFSQFSCGYLFVRIFDHIVANTPQ